MGSENYANYEKNMDEDCNNKNGFRDYGFEDKVKNKNSFKKKLAQAKRLLVNKASKEYSQVHEQQDEKSVTKMLVSVSKINDLKVIVNEKTKKYGKATSPTYLDNN